MNSFDAKSMNVEDPHALEKTLGLGQVAVKTFVELEEETRVSDGIHMFLTIRYSNRNKMIYDPTTGKREHRPLFFLESQTLTQKELEEEWYRGEFYHLSEPQDNIKIIRGIS